MFMELLKKRRSIRKFKKLPVESEKLQILKEALLRAPSSRGINPWEFVFVTDKQLLIQLSASKTSGAEFLKDSPLGIVVCADEKISDVWIEDCSIASIIVQLEAEDLELSSCWIQIRNRMHKEGMSSEKYIRDLLGIPSDYKVECIIAVGYPDETKRSHTIEELDFSKISDNKYTG